MVVAATGNSIGVLARCIQGLIDVGAPHPTFPSLLYQLVLEPLGVKPWQHTSTTTEYNEW